MRAWCAAAWKRDEGQALVEVLLLFRDSVGNSYGQVGNQVDAAGLPVASSDGATPGGALPGEEAGSGGKGDHDCGGGQGGGLGRGGGGGCGGGRDR